MEVAMEVVKAAQFTFIVVGKGSYSEKLLWTPCQRYTSSSDRKCKFV